QYSVFPLHDIAHQPGCQHLEHGRSNVFRDNWSGWRLGTLPCSARSPWPPRRGAGARLVCLLLPRFVARHVVRSSWTCGLGKCSTDHSSGATATHDATRRRRSWILAKNIAVGFALGSRITATAA